MPAEQEGLLQEVFERVPAAIIVIDERGTIVRANHSALTLLGEERLEGLPWVRVIREVFRPRKDDGHEISTRDGRRLSVATCPLAHGQLVQITDLTDTRALQDKLSHMERLSSLGRMAASLAHQIRTPLSAAMLYAANLGNPKLAPAARAQFQRKLVSRLEALEAQIGDILLYARSNDQTVARLKVSDLMAKILANVTPSVEKHGSEIAAEVEEGLEIIGNEVALTGAISNLAANAAEAGAPHVLVTVRRAGGFAEFEVADDGPPVPDGIRERIFEPFFTTKSNGTGLGLAVVNAVAKVHQGRLELSSSEDFPAIFTLSIPLAQ
ncbi:MAG: PAS domain-containing sensor histidine kinase [Succinivibrionaceae bacterium]|nr:PAS domain-containing sensor histidine kinase [Succinivibrionaceae bacterium]